MSSSRNDATEADEDPPNGKGDADSSGGGGKAKAIAVAIGDRASDDKKKDDGGDNLKLERASERQRRPPPTTTTTASASAAASESDVADAMFALGGYDFDPTTASASTSSSRSVWGERKALGSSKRWKGSGDGAPTTPASASGAASRAAAAAAGTGNRPLFPTVPNAGRTHTVPFSFAPSPVGSAAAAAADADAGAPASTATSADSASPSSLITPTSATSTSASTSPAPLFRFGSDDAERAASVPPITFGSSGGSSTSTVPESTAKSTAKAKSKGGDGALPGPKIRGDGADGADSEAAAAAAGDEARRDGEGASEAGPSPAIREWLRRYEAEEEVKAKEKAASRAAVREAAERTPEEVKAKKKAAAKLMAAAAAAAAAAASETAAAVASSSVGSESESIGGGEGLRGRIVRARRPEAEATAAAAAGVPSEDDKKEAGGSSNNSDERRSKTEINDDDSSEGADENLTLAQLRRPRSSTNRFAALNDSDDGSDDDNHRNSDDGDGDDDDDDGDDRCECSHCRGCRSDASDIPDSDSDPANDSSSDESDGDPSRVQCAICFRRSRVDSLVTLPCCGSGRREQTSSTRFCAACIVQLGKKDMEQLSSTGEVEGGGGGGGIGPRCMVGECPRCRDLIMVTPLGPWWSTPRLSGDVRVNKASFAVAVRFAGKKGPLSPLLYAAAFANPHWIPVELLCGDSDRASRLVRWGILDKPKKGREGVYTIDPERQAELRRLQPTCDHNDGGRADEEDDYDDVPCLLGLTAKIFSVGWNALVKFRILMAVRLFNQGLTTALFANGFVPGKDEPLRPWQGWVITALNVFVCSLVAQCLTVVAVYGLTLYGAVKAVGSALFGKPIPRWFCGTLYFCALLLTEEKRLPTWQYGLLYTGGLVVSKGRIPPWLYGAMFVEVLPWTKFASWLFYPLTKIASWTSI